MLLYCRSLLPDIKAMPYKIYIEENVFKAIVHNYSKWEQTS